MADELRESWADLNVPPKDDGCSRCGKTVNDEGDIQTPVLWRCMGCNRLVCRDCTLTLPGWRRPTTPHGRSGWSYEPSPGGRQYYSDTLCSVTCWERMRESGRMTRQEKYIASLQAKADAAGKPLGPQAQRASCRPSDYAELSPQVQWDIDKSLSILDWDGNWDT